MTAQYHGYCTGSEQQPCDSCAMAVRMPHESTISVRFFFAPMFTEKSYVCCTISARPPGDARAGIVQCHLRHVYGLRAYDFFSNLFNFLRNKIVKAAESVNPYENLTAASCLRTEAARKRRYGQDTGSVDKSQAKCNPGISS